MVGSIKNLRKQLKITLEELGNLLEVGRARVHNFESGKAFEGGDARDKLNLLSKLVRASKNSEVKNPWVDHEALNKKAEDMMDFERSRSATLAKELGYQLQEMKAEYESCLKAMDIMASMQENAECTPELKRWIKQMAPVLVKRTLKNGPEQQMKLQIRRNEALGRAR